MFYQFLGAGGVWFSLNGTIYHNNSCVALEDIGEGDDALLCMTNFTVCCGPSCTGENGPTLGKWFLPNENEVLNTSALGDFYTTSGYMVVCLNHRRGGSTREEGIYRCEIPDSMNFNRNIYIGVYSAGCGEWCMYTQLFCLKYHHP